jgi:RNA recognition motif-containing protein
MTVPCLHIVCLTSHRPDELLSNITSLCEIPPYPQGPPRRPTRSGHALWVGNIPSFATAISLKNHFSQDTTLDLLSIYLMPKRNCAFVNYRTAAACATALGRFDDSTFCGSRIRCRPQDVSPGTAETGKPAGSHHGTGNERTSGAYNVSVGDVSLPVIVKSTPDDVRQLDQAAICSLRSVVNKMPERFFILKSLTVQDLDSSVQSGLWVTQPHNERFLHEAFKSTEAVYLIFSANRSGEYFGYARMVSSPVIERAKVRSPDKMQSRGADGDFGRSRLSGNAAEIGGIVVPDPARGTEFWESNSPMRGQRSSSQSGVDDNNDGECYGQPFKIVWFSITRVSFYRTRGLCNLWNADREVKVAKDGTEVEPSVGRRLLQRFH